MAWTNILDGRAGDPAASMRARAGTVLGCQHCPLNGKGTKIKGLVNIKQRRVMLWSYSPGRAEEVQKKTHVGRQARFIWNEFRRVGLTREMFDIQYTLRCMPDKGEPDNKAIKNCKVYNSEALDLNQYKAKLHVVFGKLAAQSLLGDEYSGDNPIFWSEALDARVVVLAEPEYFLRGAPPWKLEQFRARVKAVKYFYDHPEKFHYLKHTCDLSIVKTDQQEEELFAALKAAAKKKIRISVDFEEGTVKGKRVILMVGFSWKRLQGVTLPLDHPEADSKKRQRRFDRLTAFLSDPKYRKVFQYGPYDTEAAERILGVRVHGYRFDTTYAHYLVYPFLRSHGLAAIATEGYPLFAGYKSMVDHAHLEEESLEVVALYNAADAALTKLIELDYGKVVPTPLMYTYVWAGISLYDMQKRGPLLDRLYMKYVKSIIPPRLDVILRELKLLVGDPEFNPKAQPQVSNALFKKFKFEVPEGEKDTSTKEEVLTAIIAATDHPFPKLMLEYRRLSVMLGNHISNYEKSADLNDGELHTTWHLTGAVTGRLRSGGSKKRPGLINMQNLHGETMLQNLLVSDINWREVEQYIQ